MTKQELFEILKIMHKDAKAVPWGRCVPYYEFYQDENGQKPRLTPEEKSKWENLSYADNLFKDLNIYRTKLKTAASHYLNSKKQKLASEGKAPISEEDYVEKGGFLSDEEFLNDKDIKSIELTGLTGRIDLDDYSFEDVKRRAAEMKSAYQKYVTKEKTIDPLKAIQDDYWVNYGRPTVTRQQVSELKKRVQKLEEKGVDFSEYISANYEKEYKEKNKVKTNPLQFALLCGNGPRAEETAMCRDQEYYRDASRFLDDVERKLNASIQEGEKEFAGPDIGGEALSIWFNTQIFEEMDSMSMLDSALGNTSKMQPKERLSILETVTGIDPAKIDPDKIKNFDKDTLKEASELYKANKADFDKLFRDMYTHRHGRGFQVKELKRMQKLKEEEPDLYKKANRFRHLLHKISMQNERYIKLGTDARPVFVEPLPKDANIADRDVRNKEVDILDTCYEMLEEPSQRVHKNSDEYQKIMRSVHNIQKKLLKSSDNKQAAREEYVEGMEMIMHNIKMYYLHKAKDGIAADATYDKLMAVKRVEKLLQSRYKEVEKKDYEEKTKDVPNMFKYEPNRKLSGDEYVLDLVKGEIGNIRKELFDYKEENNEIKRSNSFVATDVKQTLENADKKAEEKGPEDKKPEGVSLT